MGVSNMSKALPRSVDAQHEENVMEREMKEYSAVSEKSSRRTQSSTTTAAVSAPDPRRVTFVDDVKPAVVSNPKNARPVKPSSVSAPSAKDGARSGASFNKSSKSGTEGTST